MGFIILRYQTIGVIEKKDVTMAFFDNCFSAQDNQIIKIF